MFQTFDELRRTIKYSRSYYAWYGILDIQRVQVAVLFSSCCPSKLKVGKTRQAN